MKKILPFILLSIVLVSSCTGVVIFNNKEKENNKPNNKKLEIQKINENFIEDNVNDSIDIETNEEQISQEDEKIKTNKKNNDVNNNKNTSQTKEVINQSTNIGDDNNSNKNEKPSNSNQEDNTSNKEEVVPQVDAELERLKSLIKYKDSQECYDASIDVSLEYLEDPNFEHTACESLAYKGQLIGYRMLIYYRDGTTKHLDAIE